MIIDFKKIDEKILKNFNGGEKDTAARMYVDDNMRILKGKLCPGASIGLHTHETSCEVVFILKGRGTVLYNGKYEDISKGMCHYCPKGQSHSLINNSDEDLVFLGVVPQQ